MQANIKLHTEFGFLHTGYDMKLEREINKVLDCLGRKTPRVLKPQLESAIRKALERKSVVKDWKKFLRICLEPDPKKVYVESRTSKVFNYLTTAMQDDDLVATICRLLKKHDPCFWFLALFNLTDFHDEYSDSAGPLDSSLMLPTTIQPRTEYQTALKSLIQILLWDGPWEGQVSWAEGFIEFPKSNPYVLQDRFLFDLIDDKIKQKDLKREDIDSVLIQVAAEVGFLVFNFSWFRQIASTYETNPIKRDQALALINALSTPFLNRIEITEKKYWLFYVLVEKLRGVHGLRGAFRKVGELVGNPPKTIQRRYFEIKKKATRDDLSLDDIISKYHLQRALQPYLEE